uniref:Short-chain type dehydrogenase/reductase-like n=1 Tax=Nicotiana sylvestris TaxID=4096 RepID=A0A1U7VAY7_NICSY|nr:PREDICTED: short-chain type dehydrogenase/reductase-like [Nicotiana sylvestris]
MAGKNEHVAVHEQSTEGQKLPLLDRVAIVTGSSRGIGKAIALHLASLGAKLVINYSSSSTQANDVVSQINSGSNSPRAVAVKANISVKATLGAFICCKEGANRIKRGGGGRIICLASSAAASFRPRNGAYTASKAAVEAMVKILAKELKGSGITANCVAPGLL